MHPRVFFARESLVNAGHCFVIMPFAKKFDDVYSAIKTAVGVDELRFTCHRADEVVRGGQVMADVLRDLAMAEIVIADVTLHNPNVFYELGIAHTVKDAESVLLLTQTVKKLPFDVHSYRCIQYSPTSKGLALLRDELVRAITPVIERRRVFAVVVGAAHDSEAIFPGDDGLLYSFTICNLQLGIDVANYQLDVFQHRLGRPAEHVHHDKECRHRLGVPKPIPGIPGTPWALKLDAAGSREGRFCVCIPNRQSA